MQLSPNTFPKAWLIAAGILLTTPAQAFDSGSSGADGAFNPIVDTVKALPEDGVFNFTSVNIPAGVTVRFEKNRANTPVTFLVSGDMLINGSINLNGGGATHSGAAGDGNLGDDGIPGMGGPGGFKGGRGGDVNSRGGNGLGPGGGVSGSQRCLNSGYGGGGAGYISAGITARRDYPCTITIPGGPSYGASTLLPLIGGSGGGGGFGGATFSGTGGGGGGGALLLAVSGKITVNGSIVAKGGGSGASNGAGCGGTGGGGSGGAIRIVATTLAGNGTISAEAGGHGNNTCEGRAKGGNGSHGRIRLEAEIMNRTAATIPGFSFAQPQEVFVAGLPSLKIASVAGVNAPAQPTGSADIVLAETTPNPVEVVFSTSNVPLGNTITLKVTPASGASVSVISDAIDGTEASGSATASINLPDGPSILSAQVSFTVTASLGQDLSRFARGEPVERVILAANMAGDAITTLITQSGKEYSMPSNQLAAF